MTKEFFWGHPQTLGKGALPLCTPQLLNDLLHRYDVVRTVCYTITPGMHWVDVGDSGLAQISEKGGELCHRG